MTGQLGRRVVNGAVWMLSARAVSNVLGLINTAVLARLLVPADFGLVALATALMAGLSLLKAFSLDIPLIQNQRAEEKHYNTAWTCNIVMSTAISIMIVALAVPVSRFYSEPRVANVLFFLAGASFIEGFNNIAIVNFRKNFQFEKEFTFLFGQRLATVVTGISLALILRSYWALLGALMMEKLFGLLLSYLMVSYRPRLSLAAFQELFGFSKWLFINNFLFFVRHRAPDFIIGKIAGTRALGLYAMSYELSDLPAAELVAPINRAVFPALAAIAKDVSSLKAAYLRVMSVVLLVVVPAAFGISAVAPELVAVLLGPQWMEAAPLIAILALAGIVSATERTIGYVCIVLARPQVMTRVYGVFVVVLVVSLLILTPRFGAIGSACACLATGLVMLPVYLRITFRLVNVRFVELWRFVWRPLAGATSMYALVQGLSAGLEAVDPPLAAPVRLLALVSAGAVVYVALVYILWKAASSPIGGERVAIDLFGSLWSRARGLSDPAVLADRSPAERL